MSAQLTIEEAKRILDEANDSYLSPYVAFNTHGDGATIDGFFTLQQLEALLVVARAELTNKPTIVLAGLGGVQP